MAETFLYLTTSGRKTGKAHAIEIWYVAHGDCYYLCSEKYDAADWVRNLQHTPTVHFYLAERGQDVEAQPGTAHVESDAGAIAAVRAKFEQKYGWSKGLFVRICP